MAKKLSTEARDGRIWLDKKEILKIRQKKRVDSGVDEMSIDNLVSTSVDMSMDNDHIVSTRGPSLRAVKKVITGEEVYKKLFEELQTELKLKQERLEGANYRVGQLEALLKDSIPLLDYQEALSEEKASRDELYKNLETIRFEEEQLKSQLREQNTDKKVYLIILFIIMLLQPLWLFLALR